MKKVIEIIKSIQEERKMTTAELERSAGLANGTLRKWEGANLKLSSLEAVASALGMKVSDLMKEVEDEI